MMNRRSSITVKANIVLDAIDPRIYGQNIEHMGRQVLGGLVAESGSKAPQDSRGFRLDVLEAIKDLNPPLLRWPGGCFADSYHWSDGIGPNRPKVPNRMWDRLPIRMIFGNPPFPLGPEEDNRFGTDEFMDLCRSVGAEPSITASLGANDPEEASDWIAYIRDRYGVGAVPTWSVGNEQWNIIEPGGCASRPRKYVERFQRFSKAMRKADPDIQLIASGGDALLYSRLERGDHQRHRRSHGFFLPAPLHARLVSLAVARRQFARGLLCHRRGGIVVGGAGPTDRGNGRPPSRYSPAHRRRRMEYPRPSAQVLGSLPDSAGGDRRGGNHPCLSAPGEIRKNSRHVRHAQCRSAAVRHHSAIHSSIRLYSISCGYTGSFRGRREYSPKPNVPLWRRRSSSTCLSAERFRFWM